MSYTLPSAKRTPDPIATLVNWAKTKLYYVDQEGELQRHNSVGVDGLQVLSLIDELRDSPPATYPRIVVGPILQTLATPGNIGKSPNSRKEYHYRVRLHLWTRTEQNPPISGYDASREISEAITKQLIRNQSNIDGTSVWLKCEMLSGPNEIEADFNASQDVHHLTFLVDMQRSVYA
jgi:hypothetical protein